jgi:serine/threonine-protein kinase
MELVEGRTVGELIAAGSIPVRRLLTIATQVADGLAKAHGVGIVHRDLKPENLMVSNDGFVKILDFGLAKLAADPSDALSKAPTVAKPQTRAGTVLGTVGYMSPEQAAGLPLDFRSDQFSLGSILYEMATGKRAFDRATAVDTLSAILHDEPAPIARVTPATPAPLRWIVDRCLAKDPRERYASTVDLARDLATVREHVSELSGGESALAPGTRPRKRASIAWLAASAALAAGLVAGFLAGRRGARRDFPPPMRVSLTFPAAHSLIGAAAPVLALSPDGTNLVYVGRRPEGGRQLYLRPLDRFEATPIDGTEGGGGPFFSADGQWVGFWAERKLRKVALKGGRPLTLCDMPQYRGASWGADGSILVARDSAVPLDRVSENGGNPKPATSLDPRKGEKTHRWPQILPGGKAALLTAHDLSGNYDNARIDLLRLDTGQRRTLIEGGTDPRFAPTGHIVYVRAGSLFEVPFDLARLEVTGKPVPVLDGLDVYAAAGFANYALSPTGTLVYEARDPEAEVGELVWIDRKGEAVPLSGDRRVFSTPALSPDGRRLAVTVGIPEADIWVYDLERRAWDRLTSGGLNWEPVWSHDGKSLAFSSNQSGAVNVFRMPTDRSAPIEPLTTTKDGWMMATCWSPDDKTLFVTEQTGETGQDLMVLSVERQHTLRPFLRTPAHEDEARISPDGRWVAYKSTESGRGEIYVAAYPGPGGRWKVSTSGGGHPVWSRDGKELFYKAGTKLISVPIEALTEFRAGVPRVLFDSPNLGDYDVAPDGRFVFVRTRGQTGSPSLSVVLNWFEELKGRASAEKR